MKGAWTTATKHERETAREDTRDPRRMSGWRACGLPRRLYVRRVARHAGRDPRTREFFMTRLVSLGVILGLVAVFGLLSLRVMSSFLLPLLLAAMLVVIFGPLHRWLRGRIQAPEWVAAGLTTLFVLVIVLVPLFLLA